MIMSNPTTYPNPVQIDRLVIRPEKNIVELYTGKLQYHILKLFNPYELLTVGINPDEIEPGFKTPCLFLAHWQETGKLNSKQNPIRDVVSLESIIPPAAAGLDINAQQMLEKIARDLMQIKTVLMITQPDAAALVFCVYADGSEAEAAEEIAAFQAHIHATKKPPATRDSLRQWWKESRAEAEPPASPGQRKSDQRTGQKIEPPHDYHNQRQIPVVKDIEKRPEA